MELTEVKVLIVDDHMIIRNMIKQHAQEVGLRHIETAVDGRDALKKLKEVRYDLVLADWNMPEMDGAELLKALRADNTFDKTAFLMITAESEKSKILEVIQAGATSYLTKPFSQNDFKRHLTKVLAWLDAKNKD